VAVVLDAGGLIAIARQVPTVGALLRVAQRDHIPVRTSAAALAQVWRDGTRQANLARVLTGVDIATLDGIAGRRVGELLGQSDRSDVVDGHVALITQQGDTVLTCDYDDIEHLLGHRDVHVTVQAI
jgi:hypothetical protein